MYDDPEGPDASDADLFDDAEDGVVECPACGGAMHELADRCPRCGHWRGAGERSGRRTVGSVVLVAAVILIVIALVWG